MKYTLSVITLEISTHDLLHMKCGEGLNPGCVRHGPPVEQFKTRRVLPRELKELLTVELSERGLNWLKTYYRRTPDGAYHLLTEKSLMRLRLLLPTAVPELEEQIRLDEFITDAMLSLVHNHPVVMYWKETN